MRLGSGLVVSRLEDFIEATKHVAEPGATAKSQVEARPELNRLLVIAAFDFVQITRNAPGREAYLQAMDRGLERFEPLMVMPANRREVAEFYIDLMDIAFALIVVCVVRPLSVLAVVRRSSMPTRQRRLVAWFGIRGIGSLFYLVFALEHGVSGGLARSLIGATLACVAVSIVLHGISATPLMEKYQRRRGPPA